MGESNRNDMMMIMRLVPKATAYDENTKAIDNLCSMNSGYNKITRNLWYF